MQVTDEIRELLRENPTKIKEYPDAPIELQMLCVQEYPWALYAIANPHPEVVLEAYRRESLLIRDKANPSEEEQLAAVSHDAHICEDLQNPCRQAVLKLLEINGQFLQVLTQRQQQLGNEFAASITTINKDVELQAAALSNITGLTLFHEHPELFDREALGQEYPNLLAVLDGWGALGYTYEECELIMENLQSAKEGIPTKLPEVVVPDDMHLN